MAFCGPAPFMCTIPAQSPKSPAPVGCAAHWRFAAQPRLCAQSERASHLKSPKRWACRAGARHGSGARAGSAHPGGAMPGPARNYSGPGPGMDSGPGKGSFSRRPARRGPRGHSGPGPGMDAPASAGSGPPTRRKRPFRRHSGRATRQSSRLAHAPRTPATRQSSRLAHAPRTRLGAGSVPAPSQRRRAERAQRADELLEKGEELGNELAREFQACTTTSPAFFL